MLQDRIHPAICRSRSRLENWFKDRSQGLFFPFYSSFDIRDSGFKIVPVDANIFPAGFNNICAQDKESAVDLVAAYLEKHYRCGIKKVLLLTEEHTQNPYYWDNVKTLQDLFLANNIEVKLAMPKDLPGGVINIKSASGFDLSVYSAKREGAGVVADGMQPDLIISNNDFSEAYADWIVGLETPINPPHVLGWHSRKKSEFFEHYNILAKEFAEITGEPEWIFQVETQSFPEFDINSDESREALAQKTDQMLLTLKKQYEERGINTKPHLFIKNNSGTYGLGVVQVGSGEEVRAWNYKARKKMKAAKGGGGISQVILQEGVPTTLRQDEATAEPAIYLIGDQLAGGFLRTHGQKSAEESLNSPGAVYKRLCVSDLGINISGCPMENVYGWVAKLGFLAIALEAKKRGISCKAFQPC